MNNPKFQIFKGNDDQFYFRLFARNGEQILNSQGYTTKQHCQNGIESVKTNAPHGERFEIKRSKDDKFYFDLFAANQQIIGTSQMYASKQNCEKGIASVQNTAPEAGVEDLTV